METHKSNENTELKSFMSSLRSRNLLKLIEANQSHFQEKYTTMCFKLNQSQEEITRQQLILQLNSHSIEKFQNKLQEVTKQNSELFEKQQILQEENQNLKKQLQCSEEKFAQLDIIYDQEASALTEKVIELEGRLTQMNNMQNESHNHFNETQTELHKKLEEMEEVNRKLREQIKCFEDQREEENIGLESQNETLRQKIIDYEENIKDLKQDLAAALDEIKQNIELKKAFEKLNNDREAEQQEYCRKTSQFVASIESLKTTVDDLKKKLLLKEKETEEVYLKFKQITRFGEPVQGNPPSIQSNKHLTRKRSSSDDPKPIDNSSDSDGSSISFFKMRKVRISTESDDDNVFNGFNASNADPNQRPKVPANQARKFGFSTAKRSYPKFKHIEIPESPVVSSSATTK